MHDQFELLDQSALIGTYMLLNTIETISVSRPEHLHLKSLESLRGIAALMIVFFHLNLVLNVPYPSMLNFIPNHFGFGVQLFYTLSGFVLAFGYAERLGNGKQRAKFYIARFFRIAPLFYFMLACWTLATWVMLNKTIDPETLLLNVTFTFGLVPGKHVSVVWAGWSIGIEMLFYIIFPVLALTIKNIRDVVIAFVIACSLSAWVHWRLAEAPDGYGYMNLLTQMPFFIAGLGGYRIWQHMGFSKSRAGWILLGLAALLGLIISSNLLPESFHLPGLYLGLEALAFGSLVLSACMISFAPLEHPILRRCGELSFSLYLLHPALMAILNKLQLVSWMTARFSSVWFVFIFSSLITISLLWGLSNITYRFVEVPGIALGRRLGNKLVPKPVR